MALSPCPGAWFRSGCSRVRERRSRAVLRHPRRHRHGLHVCRPRWLDGGRGPGRSLSCMQHSKAARTDWRDGGGEGPWLDAQPIARNHSRQALSSVKLGASVDVQRPPLCHSRGCVSLGVGGWSRNHFFATRRSSYPETPPPQLTLPHSCTHTHRTLAHTQYSELPSRRRQRPRSLPSLVACLLLNTSKHFADH